MTTRKYSRLTAVLLAIFLGGIGIHHFYMGNNIRGVLYLLFCWTYVPSVLAIIDIFIILFTPANAD